MSVTVLRFLLVLGIIGHAVNMYCDRIISIFPNGRLKIEDIKTIGEEGKMAKLMEGVSEKVPMRSAVWGAYSLVLPIFIAMFPFRIIGTLHIVAMVTMLAWIFLA